MINKSVSSNGDITEYTYTERGLDKEWMNTDWNTMKVECTEETYLYTKKESTDTTEHQAQSNINL